MGCDKLQQDRDMVKLDKLTLESEEGRNEFTDFFWFSSCLLMAQLFATVIGLL